MLQTFLVIGADCQWEEQELLRAARQAGGQALFLDAHRVEIVIGKKGAALFYEGKNLTTLFRKSRLIFRRSRGAQDKMIALAMLAAHWDVPFTDSVTGIMSNLNKALFMPVTKAGTIRPIDTFFVDKGGKFSEKKWKVSFPALIKPVHGRHGEGIQIVNDKKALHAALRAAESALMIQPFLNVDAEYRVLVVGGRALGAVRKTPAPGAVIANYAAGARFTPATLPAAVLRDAVRTCREQGIDIGGVDLAKSGRTFYLLEVNRCPEFRAFSAATGIDAARAIIDFSLTK